MAIVEVCERSCEHKLPDLMVRYQAADPSAAAELVEILSPRLMRYFAASRTSGIEIEDVFQECWMRIHSSRHTYRASEPVLPWVYAIARHTRIDVYRRQRRRGVREVLVAEPPDSPPVSKAAPPESDSVGALLASLPEGQREILVMLKVSGMSLEEVARATSSSVGAIKQKAHRAYAKLRSTLKKEMP